MFKGSVSILAIIASQSIMACTNFQLVSKDNSVIIGRTMEFGVELDSKIIVRPRGVKNIASTPTDEPGLTWKNKYGYITANALDLDISVDGVNEKGLSVGYLWMPGSNYEDNNNIKADKTIDVLELGNWILGNFADVEELKQELHKIRVWAKYRKGLRTIPQIHIPVHDKTGRAIVIEFLNGKKIVHDNDIGVLTNAPSFDWHMNNLRNYAHILPNSTHSNNIFGGKVTPNMMGASLVGIPNDYTPPARFVRMAALLELANKPKNNAEAIKTTEHLIKSIDIPKGLLKGNADSPMPPNYTQWTTIKDLTKKNFYYSSYENNTLRKIELTKIDLTDNSYLEKAIAIRGGDGIQDITHKFRT